MLDHEFFEIAAPGDDDGWAPFPQRLPFLTGAEVLDVGAGHGHRAAALARLGHRVLALEPDAGARAFAVARLTRDPEVASRVSLLPHGVLDAPLPERLGGALLKHVLYQLPGDVRAAMWDRLAAHLAPGAGVLLSRTWPAAEQERVLTGQGQPPVTLGRLTYRRWFAAEQADGRSRFTNWYEVLDGDVVVHRETAVTEHETLTETQALAEVPGAFAVQELDARWLRLLRR